MRLNNAVDYEEPRESIASDWNNYMLSAFPESKFIYIPNIEENVADYINKFKINVLVLSGGDDIGVTPRRDNTELLALKYALKEKIPVIAICRGLQLTHKYYGGKLVSGNNGFITEHKATTHLISIDNKLREVNSFHTNKIDEESLNPIFKIIARCKSDNSIEAFESENILALMWHPERDKEVKNWNLELINKFLRKWKTEH